MNQSRRVARGVAAILLVLTAGACSSDDTPEAAEPTTASPASAPATSGAAAATAAPSEPSATTGAPATTGAAAPAETSAPVDGSPCASVPGEAEVEAVIGAAVLPVEDQGSLGCAYIGDGNNVGVYFDPVADEFELAAFDAPDPQFATLVDDPNLPPGSFVQSGDFFAKKNDVLYKVVASVNGTDADNDLAKQLMIAWLALVP